MFGIVRDEVWGHVSYREKADNLLLSHCGAVRVNVGCVAFSLGSYFGAEAQRRVNLEDARPK